MLSLCFIIYLYNNYTLFCDEYFNTKITRFSPQASVFHSRAVNVDAEKSGACMLMHTHISTSCVNEN